MLVPVLCSFEHFQPYVLSVLTRPISKEMRSTSKKMRTESDKNNNLTRRKEKELKKRNEEGKKIEDNKKNEDIVIRKEDKRILFIGEGCFYFLFMFCV